MRMGARDLGRAECATARQRREGGGGIPKTECNRPPSLDCVRRVREGGGGGRVIPRGK